MWDELARLLLQRSQEPQFRIVAKSAGDNQIEEQPGCSRLA
jgi:hypothetical protein